MKKLREFWIRKEGLDGYPGRSTAYTDTWVSLVALPDLIHVREVDPNEQSQLEIAIDALKKHSTKRGRF